ncbi:MAG: DUF4340 domain-containing protein [Clostridia bacterium]|nr:DUF4340 domain-containing protein [Clostridia bacterium]
MKKNIKILIFSGIILAVLVAALVVVLNLPSTDENIKEVSSQNAILLFDKTSLKAEDITVSNESGEYQLLGYEYSEENSADGSSGESSEQKTEIIYTMQDYASQILSKTMTDSLAEQCLYMSAIQIVDKSGSRYDEYGLKEPRSTVKVVYSDNSEVTMYVGNDAPDNKGVYLRTDGNANVYLVQKNMINMFLVDKLQMFSKVLSYSFDTDYKIQTVKISGTGYDSNIEIKPVNNKANFCNFVLTKPYREICDNNFLEDFGESLYGLNGTTVVAVDVTDDDIKKYGLDKPYIDVEVTASDDTSVHLIASKADSDKNCYIMQSGGTIIYKMSTDELSWYGVTYRDFLDDSIIRPNTDYLESAEIYYGGKNYHFDVKHTTTKNDLYEDMVTTKATYNGKEIKYLNLSIFINNVAGISRSDAVPKSIDGCEKIFSIKYSFKDEKLTDTLEIYRAKDKQLIVTLNGNIEGYTDTEYAEKVFKQVDDIPKNAELELLNNDDVSGVVSEEQ